ncbi:MAG: kelch repeat-containing protein [candidate division WOR-3 bacterium]
MKKKNIKILIMGLFLFSIIFSQTWQYGPQTGFRFWRFDGEYFPITRKVYFLGGRLADNNTDGTIWCFNPESLTYYQVGRSMLIPVSNYTICILRDTTHPDTYGLYIVGGRTQAGTFTRAVQVYYPLSNNVAIIGTDSFPGLLSGQPYLTPDAAVYNNRLYVLGGFNSNISPYTTNQVWMYNPETTPGARWSQLPSLGLARVYISTCVVNGKLYAFGGCIYDGIYLRAQKYCEVLSLSAPESGWQRIADLPDSSGETRAFGFDSTSPFPFRNKIIIAGNGKWPNETPQCFIYDIETNSWSTFTNLNSARRNHAGVLIPEPLGSQGTPGMWIFGGRQGADTNILRTCEYYQLGVEIAEHLIKEYIKKFIIQPNPAKNYAKLIYPKNFEIKELKIYTKDGRMIKNLPVKKETPITLDLTDLKSGVYQLQIKTKEIKFNKVVKVLR